MPYPTKRQRYAELMQSKKTEHMGRYTMYEFGCCKASLYGAHGEMYGGELTHRQVEDICRYVAKNDWPKERREVFIRAAEHSPELLGSLEHYDCAQLLFDRIHHGEWFHRVWEEIPEAVWELVPAGYREREDRRELSGLED